MENEETDLAHNDNLKKALKQIKEVIYSELKGQEKQDKTKSTDAGKKLRKKVPRESHAEWKVQKGRKDGIELLKQQESSRIRDLLTIRHERMGVSPFTFYRGAAIIMAYDLSKTPSTGINVQACGDAHIANFGIFGTAEGRLVFDINDFDETLPAPWEWDVKRFMTSIEICGRDRGFSEKSRKKTVEEAARVYRETMRSFSDMGNLDVWYAHIDLQKIMIS